VRVCTAIPRIELSEDGEFAGKAGGFQRRESVSRIEKRWYFLTAPPVNLNHFRLLRVVGKGAFGKVRIVERRDSGLTFALKYIRKEEGMCNEDARISALLTVNRQWSDLKAFAI
jgi:serine/threonine protein kinase